MNDTSTHCFLESEDETATKQDIRESLWELSTDPDKIDELNTFVTDENGRFHEYYDPNDLKTCIENAATCIRIAHKLEEHGFHAGAAFATASIMCFPPNLGWGQKNRQLQKEATEIFIRNIRKIDDDFQKVSIADLVIFTIDLTFNTKSTEIKEEDGHDIVAEIRAIHKDIIDHSKHPKVLEFNRQNTIIDVHPSEPAHTNHPTPPTKQTFSGMTATHLLHH